MDTLESNFIIKHWSWCFVAPPIGTVCKQ